MSRAIRWTLAMMLVAGTMWAIGDVQRAAADADPASDVLLGSPDFFPYQPAPAQKLQNQLTSLLAKLRRRGLNLKVAIIESPIDLGAIPNMFGKPQTYADFLEQEIAFNQPQPLLVVMPAGFGVASAGPPGALAGLKVTNADKSNGLVVSAVLAVERIARSVGKPVSAGRVGSVSGSSSGGVSPLLAFGAPAIVVLLGVFIAARLQRRRMRRGP